MVGFNHPPSANGNSSPTTEVHHANSPVASVEETNQGDGPWVQPALPSNIIVNQHMKIDTDVLRTMIKDQPPPPVKSESTPNFYGLNKKLNLRPNSLDSSVVTSDHSHKVRMNTSQETERKSSQPCISDSTIERKKEQNKNAGDTVVDQNLTRAESQAFGKDLDKEANQNNSGTIKKEIVKTANADVKPKIGMSRTKKESIPNKTTAGPNKYKAQKGITKVDASDKKRDKTVVPNRININTDSEVNASNLMSSSTTNTDAVLTSQVDSGSVIANTSSLQRRPIDLKMNLNSSATASDTRDLGTNYFPTDYKYPAGIQRDTAALGRDLYLRFLHEEMRTVHVREPPSMDPWRAARLDLDYSQNLSGSVRIRKSLRHVADVFARSEHRQQVRMRASEVNIETLNYNSFQDLLSTLFQEGGMTSERVIVLFYFCADLTIRALKEQMTGFFHQLIEWSQVYIVDTLSVWVQQNGGWPAVLEQSTTYMYKAVQVSIICASIVALYVLIRRSR